MRTIPVTPVYGFPFEDADDQPGITLNGGQNGLNEILAEEVETEIQRVDADIFANSSDIAGLTQRVADLEAGTTMVGWVPIDSDTSSGANFSIDVTDGGRFFVGEFALLRLHMRFDLTAVDNVNLRINGNASSVYQSALISMDASNPPQNSLISNATANQSWQIAWAGTVSTNDMILTIFHTSSDNLFNFQCESMRQSDTASVHRRVWAHGSLNSVIGSAPSSLLLFPSGTTEFTNAWWWMEGYRNPETPGV